MKKCARSLSLALIVCMIVSALPFFTVEVEAANNPYASWISVFDPTWYTANNAAAASYAKGDVNKLWQYFTKVGIPKGEQASAEFNVFIYAKNYPELVKAFGGNMIQYYIHYATTGKAAGLNAKTVNNGTQQATTITTTKADPNTYAYKATKNGKVILGVNNVLEEIDFDGFEEHGAFLGDERFFHDGWMNIYLLKANGDFAWNVYNNKNGSFDTFDNLENKRKVKCTPAGTIETSQGTVELIKTDADGQSWGYMAYLNVGGDIVVFDVVNYVLDINTFTNIIKALLNK